MRPQPSKNGQTADYVSGKTAALNEFKADIPHS